MKQLWYGGTIYTMEKEAETVEAVLVEDGKILAVGSYDQLQKEADQQIDLAGTVMYPGLVDSHLHLLYYGEKLTRLDLTNASSSEEMLHMIKEAAAKTPKNKWLFGVGWNENNFTDKRIPTKEELDAIRKEPIALIRVCHHAVLGNSSALAAGNVTNQTESPAGGEIGRDKNGNLTGLLYDQAMNLISDVIPKEGAPYIESLTEILNLAIEDLLSYGLTGAHSDDLAYFGHFTNPLTAFQKTVGKKRHFRVHLLRHHEIFKEMADSDLLSAEPFIELGAMKVFTDGSLGSYTAALSEPYTDQPNSNGLFIHTDEELEQLVKLARKYDEAIAIHVIGDAGAEQAIRALEKYPVPHGKRDRLVHCCVLRDDLIDRLVKLPIVIDIQPAFVPSDFPWVIERLGERRLDNAYAWKTLIDRKIICAAGTDAPIENANPLLSIYAAVERKAPDETHNGYLLDQKLSRFQAIQLYTYGSAQAVNKEHERGLIKTGYVADFSIFDRDLFTGTSEDMLEAKAMKTVVAGRIVFDRKK